MKIAMWSGPRNLSTAMMYSFGSRDDCAVWDEPFYAAYLVATGIRHPLRRETVAAWPNQPEKAIEGCIGSNPGEKRHYYQKHMTHHMLPEFDLTWTSQCKNVFLIRHPARVITSYLQKWEEPTESDIGFARQGELFDQIAEISGEQPIVVDASQIREDPEAQLRNLCEQIGIEFQPAMLSWPAGGRPEDGPWSPHWYGSIHASTGFAGPEAPLPDVPAKFGTLLEKSMPIYERLAFHASR